LGSDDASPFIWRPLFHLFENDIEDALRQADVRAEASGCGHSVTLETQTPRELIQYTIVRPLLATSEASGVVDRLMAAMKRGLTPAGRLRFNARANRSSLLGLDYRSGLGSANKL
jgi:hypothetical protein